jgi:hypothetical protein
MSTRDPRNPIAEEDAQAEVLRLRLRRSLTNVSPSAEQIQRIEILRENAKAFADAISHLAPHSRERSLAATHLEDCVMWGVKAIILNEDPRYVEGSDGE